MRRDIPNALKKSPASVQASGLSWARRTNPPDTSDANAAVILLDTIGELPATYSLADVVFVGGSIVDRGGHNVLEPAAAGAAVVTGAHTHNFHAIVGLMEEAGAIVQLPPVDAAHAADELARVLGKLLSNRDEREELGRRAKQLVSDNTGRRRKNDETYQPPLFNIAT